MKNEPSIFDEINRVPGFKLTISNRTFFELKSVLFKHRIPVKTFLIFVIESLISGHPATNALIEEMKKENLEIKKEIPIFRRIDVSSFYDLLEAESPFNKKENDSKEKSEAVKNEKKIR